MSFVLSVSQNVARNPVARSIERARLNKHRVSVPAEMRALKTWDHAPSLLQGVAEAIAMATKTIEGWDDPEGIQDEFARALERIVEMSGAGFVWQAKHCEPLCCAYDAAVQILIAQDPKAKVKAWVWVQEINARIALEKAEAA